MFEIQEFGNKELHVTYTKENGSRMRLYGTYRLDSTPQYKDYIINVLKLQIAESKFLND